MKDYSNLDKTLNELGVDTAAIEIAFSNVFEHFDKIGVDKFDCEEQAILGKLIFDNLSFLFYDTMTDSEKDKLVNSVIDDQDKIETLFYGIND